MGAHYIFRAAIGFHLLHDHGQNYIYLILYRIVTSSLALRTEELYVFVVEWAFRYTREIRPQLEHVPVSQCVCIYITDYQSLAALETSTVSGATST